ncbi:uncharacterized protein PV06_08711 [Exophiala oligosperma]|uniref:Uncharacterized protein n=1 Tax=Exophiala oligosperma TaxID=215243 RepID=A0A0D2D8V0_9EURO|nr:uncharacterized protein PV06_08711 [Exophiala oligosperma]KIW38885.1 hypothetical protein PV06_08711 [Exophiala oligosperma]
MAQIWPPSPCVEDEEVSLSKELLLNSPVPNPKNDDQPAGSRGSVDQYPIIIDSDDSDITSKHHDSDSDNAPSQHRSSGRTNAKSTTNTEKRFVLFSPERSEVEEESPLENLHRSRSTTQLNIPEEHRGRPQVTRIHTDFGPGRGNMAADHRREPSPYAYSHPSTMESTSAGPHSGINLLSPMDAHRSRRSLPGHQRSRPPPQHDSSDSEHGFKSKRRSERSRSRAPRKSFSQPDRPDFEKTKTSRHTQDDSRRTTEDFSHKARRHRSPAPTPGGFVGYSYTSQEHITPPQSPKPLSGSTRSSASESVRDHALFRRGADQVITDSPYTSSADEGHTRRQTSGDEKREKGVARTRRASSRSHLQELDRSSVNRAASRHRDRGPRDMPSREPVSSDERPRRELHTPLSARTPKATEDYFSRALSTKPSRRPGHSDDHSRPVSPLGSPPASPPRTPRGDKVARHDFQPPLSAANTSKPRSRPPSLDDSHFNGLKPLTTLLSAATLGASLAKAIPNLSRSTTSVNTVESLSSGSQSRPSSGQRSRKASPDILIRTTSLPSRDDAQPLRTTTYSIHEDRTVQRSSTYTPTIVESPRTASRASSYSYSPETSRPAVPHRAMSTTSTQSFQQYLNVTSQQPVVSAPVTPDPVNMPSAITPRPSVPSQCPRSTPVAGLYDWYTIRDMSFLDFCPSCMNFLGGTRFRDYFIPSMPKDLRRPVQCAMSMPWVRLAWLQCVKNDKKDLSLVWDLTQPPPEGTRACPGSAPEHRRWYHLTDPRNKRPVEGFDICSACVMKIDMTFPQLRSYLFDRPRDKLNEEKVCSVAISSRHFWPILAELERLAERRSRESLRQRDIIDFVDYIRRVSRHRECTKDTMLAMTAWHFIPDLPEFTICEDCFHEVVWPLRDRPIAREVSKTLKVVPNLQRNQSLHGISCQLYSDRMRRIFHEAVSRNDFESLRAAARHRYSMEHRLQELQRRYEMDEQAGWDRRTEMEQNITIWKSIE